MHMPFRGLLVLLALLLGGCVDDGPTPGGSCSTSRDCVLGEFCLAGTCTPAEGGGNRPCVSNSECASGAFCDVQSGMCRSIVVVGPDAGTSTTPDGGVDLDAGPTDAFTGICMSDDQCGTPPVDICFQMQCVKGCGQQGGLQCTGGNVCNQATGRCETPQQTCTMDSECNPPTEICISGTCQFGCTINSSICTQDELCDPATGRCILAPTPCMTDPDCMPPMTVCEMTQCVPGCGQPGGIQCSGATPFCDMTSGRCSDTQGGSGSGTGSQPCGMDSDCGNANLICENMTCVLRCNAPGGSCPAGQVCNTSDGRCLPAGLGLGDSCRLDSQCTSDLCLGLTINMTSLEVCSQTCGSQANCPLDFSCTSLQGMTYCVSERVFTPPANFDVRAGGSCTDTNNRCQSTWCNLGNSQCLETCQRDSHCSAFGGQCWMYEQTSGGSTRWQQLCLRQSGSGAGSACTANSGCTSGICNRSTSTCAQPCCSDSDCPSNQNCNVYDLDARTGVKVCQPARGGSTALGGACTQGADCASEICLPINPGQPTSPRRCSTLCCTNADCRALPGGGTCTSFNGPVAGTLVGGCVP